jgi:hypothetical protein
MFLGQSGGGKGGPPLTNWLLESIGDSFHGRKEFLEAPDMFPGEIAGGIGGLCLMKWLLGFIENSSQR